jgi:hypothetical protein
MSNMSRRTTAEYIRIKRRLYAGATPGKRSALLDEVCETTGLSRKRVNKLLTGNIRYRVRPGRGRTYKPRHFKVLTEVWIAAGCPCTTYLKSDIGYWVSQYEQHRRLVAPEDRQAVIAMSASSMDRALKGVRRVKPGSVRRNRGSGVNHVLLDAVACRNGEEVMACLVPPGEAQIDTVALCGGDMADNFWWILTMTDRATQWTEITPTWNRGQHTTLEAVRRLVRRMPFPLRELHSDNGSEFINGALVAYFGRPGRIPLSRSRFRMKNDNAHVEQKNGSVVRELFGESRIDDPDLERELLLLCREWADFCNFFRPCKMLVSKAKRPDGKGFVRRYDAPKTPFRRVMESGVLTEAQKAELQKRHDTLNGIELRDRLIRRLNRIRRKQKASVESRRHWAPFRPDAVRQDSALRAAPSGTSCADGVRLGGIALAPRPNASEIRRKSVAYLTNQRTRIPV